MKLFKIMCIFIISRIDFIKANTHWMVTERGLIQPRVDSPFELARPYDLVAFLNQENNWNDVLDIFNDLSKRQSLIDQLWEHVSKKSDIKSLVLSDQNCLKAGQLKHINWYVSSFEDGSSRDIPRSEYQLVSTFYGPVTDIPDCKISSLIFSMSTFEHLEAMINRENLTISPEMDLPDIVSDIMTVDHFAHWLTDILRKNSSSWLHYNLASLYWRMRGNAPKALECSRLAVHYAPREYKDIALLTMGTILHLSKMAKDAVVVLNAAVDHNPKFHLSRFQLGDAYAALYDFNSSSTHLNECGKLHPNFEIGIKHKYAAACLRIVWGKLHLVHETLNTLSNELQLYSQKEAHLIKAQSSYLKAAKHEEEHDYRNVDKNYEKMSELTGLDINGLKLKSDKNLLIQYYLNGPTYDELWSDNPTLYATEPAYSLQRLVKHIDTQSKLTSEIRIQSDLLKATDVKIPKGQTLIPLRDSKNNKPRPYEVNLDVKPLILMPKKVIEPDMIQFENGPLLFPSSMKISRNTEDFDRDPEWPSNTFCKLTATNFPTNVEAIFPVFIDFRNKGIRLGSLLTDMLGVPATVEHELPWHPPACPRDKTAATLATRKSQK